MRKRTRLALLAAVIAACVGAAVVYVGLSVARSHKSGPPPGVHVVSGATLGPGAAPVRTTKASSVDTEGDSKLALREHDPRPHGGLPRRRPALRPDEPPGDRRPEMRARLLRGRTRALPHTGRPSEHRLRRQGLRFGLPRRAPVPGPGNPEPRTRLTGRALRRDDDVRAGRLVLERQLLDPHEHPRPHRPARRSPIWRSSR